MAYKNQPPDLSFNTHIFFFTFIFLSSDEFWATRTTHIYIDTPTLFYCRCFSGLVVEVASFDGKLSFVPSYITINWGFCRIQRLMTADWCVLGVDPAAFLLSHHWIDMIHLLRRLFGDFWRWREVVWVHTRYVCSKQTVLWGHPANKPSITRFSAIFLFTSTSKVS